MAESKTKPRASSQPSEARNLSSAQPPAKTHSPAEPVVPASELTQVIAEMQARLANVEKRAASARQKRAAESNDAAAASRPKSATSEADEAAAKKLEALREREQAIDIEEAALRTRAEAAAQEELLLRKETQTLYLKLQSFRHLTRKLRDMETTLAGLSRELDARAQQVTADESALEKTRQELERMRTALAAEQAMIGEREAALAAPLSAMNSQPVTSKPVLHEAPLSPRQRIALATSVAVLVIVSTAALSVTIAWLTVEPVYRATAMLAPVTALAAAPADFFAAPVRAASRSLLEQRGLRPFDSDEAMAASLNEKMTIIKDGKTDLHLSFESTHRDEAVLILEALTRSYAKANAEIGITIARAAAADLSPIRDGRIGRAMILFILILSAGFAAARLRSRALLAKQK